MVWQHYLWILFRNMSASKHIFHKSITIKFLTIHYIRYLRTTQSEENHPVNKAGLREGILRHHNRKHGRFRKLLTLHMLVFFIYFPAWTHHSLPGKAMPCKSTRTTYFQIKHFTVLSTDWWLQGHRLKPETKITRILKIQDTCPTFVSGDDICIWLLTVSTSSHRSSEAIEKSNSFYTCYWSQAWPNKSHQRDRNRLRRH